MKNRIVILMTLMVALQINAFANTAETVPAGHTFYYVVGALGLLALIISIINALRINRIKNYVEVSLMNQKEDMNLSMNNVKRDINREMGRLRKARQNNGGKTPQKKDLKAENNSTEEGENKKPAKPKRRYYKRRPANKKPQDGNKPQQEN